MAYSFEEIMSFHSDNKDVYDEIKMNLFDLVPFIGAGLTQFAYGSWTETLKKLAKKITNKKNYNKIMGLIKSKEYLDAAQLLEELRGSGNLARDLANFFSVDKLNDKQNELKKEAISLLPLLFSGLVLTTNYDRILETVYDDYGCHFEMDGHPGHSELLEQYIRGRISHGLYKFHGTVSGKYIEYDKIVFTRRQYEKNYVETSPLVEDLKKCLKKRSMFFLGCSLDKDYTMKFLEKIVEPGEYHYTIINCKKSERDDKIKQLEKKHIRAIVYEGNRHEAVRVILEHLLEETRPDIYQQIPYHVGALKSLDSLNRFSYKADNVSFIGREKEMAELNDFLDNHNKPFCWWAIIGPGGSGKSRLAYEFQKQLPLGWHSYYLTTSDYERFFSSNNLFAQKTLLIADYVQEYAKELGMWMERISEQHHSSPIRVLLIERNSNEALGGFVWAEQLYSNVRNRMQLAKKCYQKNFMELHPLLDKELLNIIESYILIMQQKGISSVNLSNVDKRILLQKLKMIDPNLYRPLFVLFLTDAYMAGKEPEHWDREDVLHYVIQRELDRLRFNVINVTDSRIFDRKLFTECQKLLCISTVLQDPPIHIVHRIRPDIWNTIEKKSDYFITPADMLNHLELANNDKILSLRPDLIGEYFVYSWLAKQSKEEIDFFLSSVWQVPRFTVAFLDRLFSDYRYLLDENPELWDILLPENISLSKEALSLYAQLRLNISYYCGISKICEKQVYILSKLAATYPDMPEVVSSYFTSFVNLVLIQNVQDAEKTVAYFRENIFDRFDNPNIVLAYVKSLANLITKQEIEEAQKTLKHLEELSTSFSDNANIVITFCSALMALNNRLNIKKAQQNIENLRKLTESNSGISEIKIIYAEALFCLANRMDVADKINILEELKKLATDNCASAETIIFYAKSIANLGSISGEDAKKSSMELYQLAISHSEIFEVLIIYAKSLVTLVALSDEKDAKGAVIKLEKLLAGHLNMTELVIAYANGLFNLSRKMDIANAKKTTQILEKLAAEYYIIPEVSLALIKALHCLSTKQNNKDAQRTLQRIETIANDYNDIPEVVAEFSNSLLTLSTMNNPLKYMKCLKKLMEIYPNIEEIKNNYIRASINYYFTLNSYQRTMEKMEELFTLYSEMKDVVVAFAMSLYNLLLEQNGSEAFKTVKRLEDLTGVNPDIPEIRIKYAEGLVLLILRQDKRDAYKTVKQLEQLAKKHPEIPELVIAYAKGLVNFGIITGNCLDTVQQLKNLIQIYTNISGLITIYAKALINLSNTQNVKDAYNTVEDLEKLVTDYNDPELLIELSNAYFNLSNKQNRVDAIFTMNKAEKLVKQYPEIPEIAINYAKSLVNVCINQFRHDGQNMVSEKEAQNILKQLKEYALQYSKIPEIHTILIQTINKITEDIKKQTVIRKKR